MGDDFQTIAVAKPVVAAPSEVAVMGANPDSPVPFVFGKRIAKGGMGAILEGEDCKLGRTIAVKVMLDPHASSEQARRFVQEAAVLGRLEHPNIVPIHDLGRDSEGSLYYTMKLVKGRTLQDILNDLRQEKKEALEHYTLDRLLTIFRKVCDALAFAHASNIIHRDLKPENVMVGEFGEVLVMDWGIAKIMGELGTEVVSNDASARPPVPTGTGSFTATMDGAVMGTPNYMSPEQAMGKVNELDERSDIFSLGGILYAILTLRPPVEGKDVWEVLEKVQAANITEPTRFGATTGKGSAKAKSDVLEAKKITPLPHMPGGRVPNALSAVAMKALTLDKTKRYQNVAAFGADIEKFQGGFATSAENAGLMKQVSLLIKRNKGIFTTAAAAWLLITGLAVWFVFNLRVKEQRALAGEEAALLEKEAARQSAASANLAVADAALREADSAGMQTALNAVPEDLRDSTWSYLLEQSDTSIARLRTGTTEIEAVAPHPRRPGVFAVADRNRKITLMDVRTGARLLEFAVGFTKDTSNTSFRLAFSPDGERIAVGRRFAGGVVIHGAKDGKKLLEWDTPETRELEFNADGKLLLQRSGGDLGASKIALWDATSGQQRWQYAPAAGYAFGAFTPDGQQVVTIAVGREDLRLVNALDGTPVRTITTRVAGGIGTGGGTTALAVSSAGLIALADIEKTVTVVDSREGRVVARFQHEVAGSPTINDLAWSPDGRQLVTAVASLDGRQSIRLWNTSTSSLMRSLLGGVGDLRGIGLHPLSGEVVASGPASHAWSLAGTAPKWRLPLSGASRIVFWGADDVVIAPGAGLAAAVQKLSPGGSSVLWKPANGGYRLPTVSADGQWATLTRSDNKSTLLLRRSGDHVEEVGTVQTSYPAFRLRLSPAGSHLVAYHSGELGCFATATGKQQTKLERREINAFNDVQWLGEHQLIGLVTSKARRLAPGTEEQVVLWDATTGKILQTATNGSAMDVLVVAPDGRRFAEAGMDKKVRIRDAATLAIVQEFRAHDGRITALAWHPTRPILATTSDDLTIRLWDLDSGRRLEELRGPNRPPQQLSFSPSGHRLGCAAENNETLIWEPQSLAEAKPEASAEGYEDLLAKLTPAIVTETGNGWRMEGGVLYSPAKAYATLPLTGDLGGTSYHLRVKLRQLTPQQSFHLNLPVGDHLVGFDLDGWPNLAHVTGLSMIGGQAANTQPGALHGKQVKDSEQHDLEVTVTLAGANATIATQLDGQPLYAWAGPTASLRPTPDWKALPNTLSLGAHAADWVVSEVKVKRLEK